MSVGFAPSRRQCESSTVRLGVLDVGSNTVHLLVVDARVGGAPAPAASNKRELRLAEHLTPDGAMSRAGADALVEMVSECRQIAEDTGCADLLPFVTSALREASNCDEVLQRCVDRTGVQLRVLTGVDEARATFLAARRWFGWSAGSLAVFDIGGGSLEMAASRDEEPEVALSVPVGAGRMARRFGASEVKKVRKHARAEIGAHVGELLRHRPFDLAAGTSKTFRTLGQLTGAAPAEEGLFLRRTLARRDLDQVISGLAGMEPSERAKLSGVSRGRADQILAGAIVADAVMDLAGVDELRICPWALREGLILNYLDHLEYFDTAGAEPRSPRSPFGTARD